MNLQYLRYALEISRTGSISKAAENLSVAQPNLSRAVKELESALGISIFERTRTGMAVTPEGEQLLSAGGAGGQNNVCHESITSIVLIYRWSRSRPCRVRFRQGLQPQ